MKSVVSTPPVRPLVEKSPDDIITRRELVRRLRTLTAKKLAELEARGLIPVIRLGHRTLRYRESSVRAALIALESEAIEK
jgi:hypothetical protein